MKDYTELLEDFLDISTEESKVIDFFNRNAIQLLSASAEDIADLRFIYIIHLDSLVIKSHYKNIIELCDTYDSSENFITYRKKDIDFDEKVRFRKAMAFYRTNQMERATEAFKILAKDFPENESYQSWLRSSQFYNRQSTYYWVAMTGILIMIFSFVSGYFFMLPSPKSIRSFGEIILLLAGFRYLWDYRRKQ